MAKKKAPKKALGKKALKATKGGSLNFTMGEPTTEGIGLLLPAVQKVRDAANRSS